MGSKDRHALANERELAIAHRIQSSFLPETLPQPEGWEIAAVFQPARQVAGDFYDVFGLTNNLRLGLVVADVCDKGVGAALFMALFRTLIRAFARQHYALRWADALGDDAGRVPGGRHDAPSIGTDALMNAVTLTNTYILDNHAASGMFATLFFGVLDPMSGALAYINGGHPPPLVVENGSVKACLEPTGPALGILPDARWEIRQTQLDAGAHLLAYTDGITEARSPAGEFYGDARLKALLARKTSSARELAGSVEADVRAFTSDAEASDDITLIAVCRNNPACDGRTVS